VSKVSFRLFPVFQIIFRKTGCSLADESDKLLVSVVTLYQSAIGLRCRVRFAKRKTDSLPFGESPLFEVNHYFDN
jgi:hypothetical protein